MSGPRRILVVDDHLETLEVTRLALRSAGYDVAIASSGAEGLRIARAEPLDLVLLDINMPGMDGWETLRLLKADEPLHDLPVVMFSVKGEVRDKVHGLQEGALDYICKPFGVDDLVARVERIFSSLGPGRRPPAALGAR